MMGVLPPKAVVQRGGDFTWGWVTKTLWLEELEFMLEVEYIFTSQERGHS